MKANILTGATIFVATLATARVVLAAVTPFAVTGYIESFKLDDNSSILSGARIKVSGIDIVIPRNLIVQMPAAFLTPFDIFCLNPQREEGSQDGNNCVTAPAESGLALDDSRAPLAAFEATVQGNIVDGSHVAGLVYISKEFGSSGVGFIKTIDRTTGEVTVGRDPSTPAFPTDARIRLNDPSGVYGRASAGPGLDPRFAVDPDNPTVRSVTGYPMCVPQASDDASCPAANRPAGLNKFVMGGALAPPIAGAAPIPACTGCNANAKAPFVVGDYVTYSGTLVADEKGRLISAHTVVASVGIYTYPGLRPYVAIDSSLIGTLGPTLTTPTEVTDRIHITGFVTDPTQMVELYAIDNVGGGAESVRPLGRVGTRIAKFGEFRLIVNKGSGALVDLASGQLRGAPRQILAQVRGSNGQTAQYASPVGEYIFAEGNVPGDPLPPNNFECFSFLQYGSGPLTTNGRAAGPTVGRLNPWPGAPGAGASIQCQ